MAKYQSKPKVVEAVQYHKGMEHPGVMLTMPNAVIYPDTAYVTTIHEQPAFLKEGDWIVTEPDGVHYYPVRDDVFKASYELIPGQS